MNTISSVSEAKSELLKIYPAEKYSSNTKRISIMKNHLKYWMISDEIKLSYDQYRELYQFIDSNNI